MSLLPTYTLPDNNDLIVKTQQTGGNIYEPPEHRKLVGSQWLEAHLEGFVRKRLGLIPNIDTKDPYGYVRNFSPKYVTGLKEIWREGKRRAEKLRMPILLAGRDVYLLEIFARLEGYPTIWRPDISSATAPFITENYSECFLLDTGYKGTVPAAMKIPNFSLISYRPTAGMKNVDKPLYESRQLFPKVKENSALRGLASLLEGAPKYWTRAYIRENPELSLKGAKEIVQGFSSDDVFNRSAQLTMHLCGLKPKAQPKVMVVAPLKIPIPKQGVFALTHPGYIAVKMVEGKAV